MPHFPPQRQTQDPLLERECHPSLEKLKKAFTTAPVLTHPDPDKPFIVEVYASTNGVGAVLSQQQGRPLELYPCAFFSKNYDVGNRELLAIKLALGEGLHWLELAKHPFLVLTDHRNLEYLREEKRLNPRQARWALFFTCLILPFLFAQVPKTSRQMLYLGSTPLRRFMTSLSPSCHLT